MDGSFFECGCGEAAADPVDDPSPVPAAHRSTRGHLKSMLYRRPAGGSGSPPPAAVVVPTTGHAERGAGPPEVDDTENNNDDDIFGGLEEEGAAQLGAVGIDQDPDNEPERSDSPPPPPPPPLEERRRWWNRLSNPRQGGDGAVDDDYEVEIDTEKADGVRADAHAARRSVELFSVGTASSSQADDPHSPEGAPSAARASFFSFGSGGTKGRSPSTFVQGSVLEEDKEGDDEEGDDDEDDETVSRKNGPEKSSPWSRLGDEAMCGFSYRFCLLFILTLVLSCLMFFLVLKLAGGGGSDSGSSENQAGAPPAGAPPSSAPVDNSGLLGDDDGADGSGTVVPTSDGTEPVATDAPTATPFWFPCNEEGVTARDGVILGADQVLAGGQYRCSPSQTFMVGLSPLAEEVEVLARSFGPQVAPGDLVVQTVDESQSIVWSAGVTGGVRAVMEASGRLVVQNEAGEVIWSTETSDMIGLGGVQLTLSDEGTISIRPEQLNSTAAAVYYWLEGNPAGEYTPDRPSNNLAFPVRGTFYYATYGGEETWQFFGGSLPQHQPKLGWYESSDPAVVEAHVDAMTYGNIGLAISSWGGTNSTSERTRTTMLLEETSRQGTNLAWTVLHEEERQAQPSTDEIRSDLDYLKKWFAWHSSWAHIDDRPVIFVNNNAEGCDVVQRWMNASAEEWFVVLRVFDGFVDCGVQPDSWHDQLVGSGVEQDESRYFTLAPGKWRAGDDRPELDRVDGEGWCQNVQRMKASGADWQLIISFNEGRVGTSIEPSGEWDSESGYGVYLDCLHDDELF